MRVRLQALRLLVLPALVAVTSAACADDAAVAPPLPWRLERVAADDPALWPAGDWRPVLRTDLDRYLNEQSLPPGGVADPESPLWRAEYVGRVIGDELRGDCRWTLPAGRIPGGDVVLRPLNLRLANVREGAQPAIWGRRSDGDTILSPAADAAELTAEWSVLGRRVFDDLELTIESPLAAVSRYILELPRGQRLTSTAGVLTGPEPGSKAGLQRWTLEAGRRTLWTLTVSSATVSAPAAPPLVRESQAVTVLSDGLDFVADYELAAGAAGELEWELPAGLQLSSATLGAETAIPFRVSGRDSRRRVRIAWPDSAAERESRLRLRGFAPVGAGELEPLPLLRLLNAGVLESQLAVHVRPPAAAEALAPDGYRIVDRRTDADQVETWLFQAVRRDAGLALRLTSPPPRLAYQIASAADLRGPIARWRTRLHVTGGGGATFTIRSLYPADWDVVDVAPFRGEAATVIAGFETVSAAGSRWKSLIIQLRQALEADDELDLLVTAVRPAPPPGAAWESPLWRPESAVRVQGSLAIIPPPGMEVAGELPAAAAAPAAETLSGLRETAPDIDLSQAVFLEYPGLDGADEPQPLFLEPVAPREPAPALKSESTDAATAAPPAPRVGELRLTTHLADAQGAHHQHVAEFTLLVPFSGGLRFQLPVSCAGVSLAADDVAVDIRSGPAGFESAAFTARRTIAVRYRSAAAGAGYVCEEKLPLPVCVGVSPPLTWRIHPSATRACADVTVPFGRVVERSTLPWVARCFGPLAAVPSRGGEPQAEAGDASWPQVDRDVAGTAVPGVLQVEAAEAPAVLAFRSWNPALAERIAWAVLMGALVLGGVVRQLRSWRWRRAFLAACIGLFAATWFATDPYVRPAGAASVGAILSLWLPRKVLLRGERRSTRAAGRGAVGDSHTRSPLPAATAGVILWCLLAAVAGLRAQPPGVPAGEARAVPPLVGLLPERDGEVSAWAYLTPQAAAAVQAAQAQRPAATRWLVREATFNIAVTDEAVIEAQCEVWLPPFAGSTPVRLAFGDVTFDSADAVQVDGRPATLIPAAQNDGVFVYIEPPAEAGAPDGDSRSAGVWTKHDIALRCRAAVQSDGRGSRVAFRVPPATGLRVRLTGVSALSPALRINGRPVSATGECLLGGVTQLEAVWPAVASAADEGAAPAAGALATVLDLGPLQHTAAAAAWLSAPPELRECRWSLPLRPEWALQQVEAPPGVRWRERASPQGPVLDVAAYAPSGPFAIGVTAVRPVDPERDAAQAVSMLPVWRDAAAAQVVQWRVPAGFEADVRDRGLPLTTNPAAWSGLPAELQARLGPLAVAAAEWTAAAVWTVQLRPQATTRAAAIDQRLTAQRTRLEWRAVIALDVAGAPTPHHALTLDPQVTLDRVAVLHDGADRLVRQVRRGERLELVLSRPVAGALRIELEGSAPLSGRETQPLPRLAVEDGRTVSAVCRVTNLSGWDVEFTPPAGAALRLPATPPNTTPAELLLALAPGDAPWGVRLLPGPDAAVFDAVLQLLPGPGGRWQQRYAATIRPEGVPLAEVRWRVPPELQSGLVITPADDVVASELQPDGWRQVTFRPGPLRGGVYRIQFQSDLASPAAASDWTFAPPQCRDAVAGDEFVVADPEFPLRPTSAAGTAVTGEGLPPRLRWLRRNGAAALIRMTPGRATWTFTPYDREAAATFVPLAETIVWLDARAGVRGVTTLTLLSTRADRLRFRTPAGLQALSWSVDGVARTAESRGSELTVEVPPQLNGSIGILTWQSPEPGTAGGEISLPQPRRWTPGAHVAAVVSADSAGLQPATVAAPAAVACRRMEGLLTAMDRLATRTLPLDCPLLESLRAADAELDRIAASPATTPAAARECRALRERWRLIHERVSVQAEAPGGAPEPTGAQRPWELLDLDRGVQAAILPADAAALPLAPGGSAFGPVLPAGLLLALLAAVLWLHAAETTQRFADWLAERPEIGCLLLGLVWTAALQPRVVGVVLILAGLAGLSRRRPRISHQDTALIGPGR